MNYDGYYVVFGIFYCFFCGVCFEWMNSYVDFFLCVLLREFFFKVNDFYFFIVELVWVCVGLCKEMEVFCVVGGFFLQICLYIQIGYCVDIIYVVFNSSIDGVDVDIVFGDG